MARGNKRIVEARYWNTNGIAIAIIAIITEDIDWAAYVGATDMIDYKDDTLQWTAHWGAKLWESDARHFFPNMDLPYKP